MGKSSDLDVYLGNKVKSKRITCGLSQEALGKSIGVTFQQVQKYEKGSNRLSCSQLWKISEVLDVPISYFFEGIDQRKSGRTVLQENETIILEPSKIVEKELALLSRYFNMIKDKTVRKNILALVKNLATSADDNIQSKSKIKQLEEDEIDNLIG